MSQFIKEHIYVICDRFGRLPYHENPQHVKHLSIVCTNKGGTINYLHVKQESIPVGCVTPAFAVLSGETALGILSWEEALPLPLYEQNHRCLGKHYLSTTSLAGGKNISLSN